MLSLTSTISFLHNPDHSWGQDILYFFVLSLIWLITLTPVYSQTPRNLLTRQLTEQQLADVLVLTEQWHPFPTIHEADQWQLVPATVRQALVQQAGQYWQTKWELLPAQVLLEFSRTGNRKNYEDLMFARRQKLATLVLGELFENQGRFLDDITNGIWATCEETFWGIPAHLPQPKKYGLPDVTQPEIDLFAAETGALLAWTYYLLGDRLDSVSPRVRERMRYEIALRILTPALERDDFWWLGWNIRTINNWNPWINSNWLATVLIMETNATRRVQAVYKIMRSLDNFLNAYPDDGSCDEGPSYWGRAGASLYECLDLLAQATQHRIDLFKEPLIRKIAAYIYQTYIQDRYFVNLGDAAAQVQVDAELVYQYGKSIDDPVMQGFGVFLAQRRGAPGPAQISRFGSPARLLNTLWLTSEIQAGNPWEPLGAEYWLPDLQLMSARTQPNSNRGFYLAAWGGHNGQSHNHNDVGNFMVYCDGKPALIDIGVETYTAKTFSPQRYEIWTMQSAFHNLPTINGYQQKDGREYAARDVKFSSSPARVTFSLDLGAAYPAAAQINFWRRMISLQRDANRIELVEEYDLQQVVTPVQLNFITPRLVDITTPGTIRLRPIDTDAGHFFTIEYDPQQFQVDAEEIALTDAQLQANWGERLARIILTAKKMQLKGQYQFRMR